MAKTRKVGDVMEDGTIYAGISPTTHRAMYAAPADAPLGLSFNEAAKYAQELDVGGSKDFRLPTREELDVLYQNKDEGALKGTFNLSSGFSGHYRTSERAYVDGMNAAWIQRFSDGAKGPGHQETPISVRCIR